MKLIDCMFLWTAKGYSRFEETKKRVAVVEHMSEAADRFRLLPKSMGACCSGWRSATPLARAAHALALFRQMTARDGISVDEVHSAFMDIDEYRAFHAGEEDDENAEEENPFKQAYWAFAAIPQDAQTL